MKRFSLLASGLTLGLAACNSSDNTSVTTAPASTTTTTPSVVVTLPATKVDTTALNGTTKDAAASKVAVAAASATAQDAFQAVFDSASGDMTNPMGSQKAALISANNQMRAAFQADPNNTQACFGLAVTSLAVRTQDMGETMGKLQDEGLSMSSPNSAGRAQSALPGLARAMANPSQAPSITSLQDSVELKLFPTLDSAIFLLQKAWKDQHFTFKVKDPDMPGDSLVIDRGDVGFALAGLKGMRAYMSWLVSYNADVRKDGSYAWVDTLDNIEGDAPATAAQKAAFDHVKSLIAANSSFLKVRSGKEALLGSVVPQIKEALAVAKEAATVSYQLKKGADDRLLNTVTTVSQRDKVIEVADSAVSWLSGPRTVTLMKINECESNLNTTTTYKTYNPVTKKYDKDTTTVRNYSSTYTQYNLYGVISNGTCGDSYTASDSAYNWKSTGIRTYTTLSSETVQTRFDLSALLRLTDLKVFLPNSYVWNEYGTWETDGPFSLSNGTTTKTANSFDEVVDSNGPTALKGWLRWSDPTFGGAFPDLTTSDAVLDLASRVSGSKSSSARVGVAYSLLR